MSGRVINALLLGPLLTFIIDVIIFIGLKNTYLAHFDIKEFFNPFFFDNQDIFIFLGVSFILGVVIFLFGLSKYFMIFYMALFVLSFIVFTKPVGMRLGEVMFMQKQVPITDTNGKTELYDIIYDGRKYLYLRKNETSIILIVDKSTQISR